MHKQALSEVETGRRHLRLGEAIALCEALRLDIGAVVGKEPLVVHISDEARFE